MRLFWLDEGLVLCLGWCHSVGKPAVLLALHLSLRNKPFVVSLQLIKQQATDKQPWDLFISRAIAM